MELVPVKEMKAQGERVDMRSVCCADRSMSRSETMPTFRNLFVPLSPRLVVSEGVFILTGSTCGT